MRQDAIQLFNDNGTDETDSTTKAGIGVDITDQALDENIVVRFVVQETAGFANANFRPQLEIRLNGGTYQAVNATSTIGRSSASTVLVDQEDTTQRVGSGTFLTPNEGVDEVDGRAGLNGINFVGNDEAEFAYCFQVRSADVSGGDNVEVRIDSGSIDVYGDPEIKITIVASGGTINNVTTPGSGSNAVTTDSTVELRERNRIDAEVSEVIDADVPLRLRYRVLSDSLVVTDLAAIAISIRPAVLSEYIQKVSDALWIDDVFSYASRFRNREQSDSINVEDVHSSYIENNEENIETIDPNDDSVEVRFRNRLQSDSFVVTDNTIATYIPEGDGVINNVTLQDLTSVAVNDVTLFLRERNREQSQSVEANDFDSISRLRNRGQSDSIDVDDVNTQYIESNNVVTETIDPNDDSIELRERNRIAIDNAVVIDNVIATYIPEDAGEINNVTLSDAIAVTDQLVALRERIREQVNALDTNDSLAVLRLRNRLSIESLDVSDDRLRDIVRSLLDVVSVGDDTALLRERYRALLDSINVADSITATVETGVSAVTLLDSIDVTDNAIAQRNVILGQFLIRHGIEELNVDYGLEINVHALHGITEETS